nr:unnamed protein product [Digitaria exilis]
MGDIDALGDEGEEALKGVDLVGVEAGVEERGDGGVVGVVVEVRVGAHAPHHPGGRGAARLEAEHPGAEMGGSRSPEPEPEPEEGKKKITTAAISKTSFFDNGPHAKWAPSLAMGDGRSSSSSSPSSP